METCSHRVGRNNFHATPNSALSAGTRAYGASHTIAWELQVCDVFFLSSAARLVPKFPGALRQDDPAARLGPSARTSRHQGEY